MYNKTHFLKARERSNLASKSYTNLQRNYTRRKAVSNTECKLFYSLCKNCANVQMCSANCATVRQIHFYFFLGMTSVYSSWSHPERSTRRVDPLTPPPAGYTSIAGVLLCVTAHTSLPNVILFLSLCVFLLFHWCCVPRFLIVCSFLTTPQRSSSSFTSS